MADIAHSITTPEIRSRRTVLKSLAAGLAVATGGVAAVAASTGAQHPDAALLAACEEWRAAYRHWVAMFDADPEDENEEEREAFYDEQVEPRLKVLGDLPAATIDGIAAKIAVLREDGIEMYLDADYADQKLMLAVLAEIESMGGKAVAHA